MQIEKILNVVDNINEQIYEQIDQELYMDDDLALSITIKPGVDDISINWIGQTIWYSDNDNYTDDSILLQEFLIMKMKSIISKLNNFSFE